MNQEEFAAHYAQLTDAELAKIASSRRTLVPLAAAALDLEIAKRGLSAEDIKRFKNWRHSYREPESPLQRKVKRSKLLSKVNQLRTMPTLRWRGLLVMFACTLPLCALFDHFGVLDLFMPAFGTVSVLVFTLRSHWELRRRPWFWVTVGAWSALHVWMLARIDWPSKWVPGRTWAGGMTIDLVVLFVAIALVEKFLHEGRYAKAPCQPRSAETSN